MIITKHFPAYETGDGISQAPLLYMDLENLSLMKFISVQCTLGRVCVGVTV